MPAMNQETRPLGRCIAILLGWVCATVSTPLLSAAIVRVERLPEGGVQPKLVASTDGSIHLVYLAGDSRASDVFYQTLPAQSTAWSKPLPVNSQPGGAIAIGTIRGADLAMGREGLVHVVWNGSDKASPRPKSSSPLLYTKKSKAASSFEPERNLIQTTRHLDGGGTVAADGSGNVYVFWHASGPDVPDGEEARTVFLTQSPNDGTSFTPERSVSPASLGACGCCGMSAIADSHGTVYGLFRAAGHREDRDSILLKSTDHGASFTTRTLEAWKGTQCPMSLPSLSSTADGVIVSWETGRLVASEVVGPHGSGKKLNPTGSGKRKHPITVQNRAGQRLMVWSEGTGWQKGGAVEWQQFDAKGTPIGSPERREGLPVWSRPAAVVDAADNFLVMW